MSVYSGMSSSACGCDDTALVSPLMPVSRAIETGLSMACNVGEVEVVALEQARGRVLARPVRAQQDMPGFDNSGMDGYAICTRDMRSAKTPVLPVQGTSAAGDAVTQLAAGTGMQHKTGRCECRPATLVGYGSDGLEVISTGSRTHSAQLAPLAHADGLVLIPAEVECLKQGDLMEFLPFAASA